jgi:hypothetical protein
MRRGCLKPAGLTANLRRIAALAVWLSTAVSAQATAAESEEAKFWKQNFAGWIGIGFSCRTNPDESWMTQICDAARQHARFLAATAKIQYVDQGDGSTGALMELAREGNYLTDGLNLSVKVLGTNSRFRVSTFEPG